MINQYSLFLQVNAFKQGQFDHFQSSLIKMFATRIKPRAKPLLVPSLQKYKGLIRIQKGKIPDLEQLYDYNCCLLVQNYKDQNDRNIQINKLQFIHKTTGRTFSLEVSDIAYSHSSAYELNWREKEQGEPFIRLGDPIGISLSVNSLEYKSPTFEILYPDVSVLQKKQTNSKTIPKLKFLKNKALENVDIEGLSQKMRMEYLKEEKMMDWGNCNKVNVDPVKNDEDNHSQFDSDLEYEERANEVCQIKSTPKTIRQIVNNGKSESQKSIDYCQSMRNSVKTKLTDFFRNYENHKKKIPQIKQWFKSMNINVPQKPLKQLIAQICTSPHFDKIKGYQLKSIFLTPQDIEQRRKIEESMQSQTVKQKKIRKKASKKIEVEPEPTKFSEQDMKLSFKEYYDKLMREKGHK